MEISDIRNGLYYQFAVKPKVKAKDAVRRWMLRAHRKRHLRLERLIEYFQPGNVVDCCAHTPVDLKSSKSGRPVRPNRYFML
jgi:hypothetical protein